VTTNELLSDINIDDLEQSRTSKIKLLSDFFAIFGCSADFK